MFESFWKKVLRRKRLSLYSLAAFGFWIVSLGYRLAVRLHQRRPVEQVRLKVPVISIGNISVGGTGKTPLVRFLTTFFQRDRCRVGIVSSGYGRVSTESFLEPGYRVQELSAEQVGDEVRFLASDLPHAVFSVDANKTSAAERLADSGEVDLIIVDDGFQHRSLYRDIDIVAYDAAIKRRNLAMFPYGVLREPETALGRADVVIITRSNFSRDITRLRKRIRKLAPDAAHYHAQFMIRELVSKEQRRPIKYLEDKSVFLFAGVGNFRVLRKMVTALCGDLDGWHEFSDHQQYDTEIMTKLKSEADKYDSDVIITTGKDWVKLGDFDFDREIYYLAQSIDLDPGEEKLVADLQQRLKLVPQEE